MDSRIEITGLLNDWGKGDAGAGEALTPLVYDELHRCAERLFRGERPGHTLQPTALVHEAYARLVYVDVSWRDRAHFYALAARMMKRLLINHANARLAAKRGGDAVHVTLNEEQAACIDAPLIELTDALAELEATDARKAELIELKYFGGLTTEEIAAVTGLSVATIGRDLRFARAWLKDKLSGEP
ncbi:MAG: sigma-70 family RNA polymerase sigma factor [Parvularculaceae bacterium]